MYGNRGAKPLAGRFAGLAVAVAFILTTTAAGAAMPVGDRSATNFQQPTPGAWIVSTHETYEDQTLDIKGNILIQDGGTLELVRSTLVMNATPPAEPLIEVQGGGKLVLTGSPERATFITDGPFDDESGGFPDRDFHYKIRVEEGGTLTGRFCNITDVGRNSETDITAPEPIQDPGLAGLLILGGTFNLSDCVLYDSHDGFYAENATVRLDRYEHIPGSRYMSPTIGTGNFEIIGGSAEIRNSSFTYSADIEGVDSFLIQDSIWLSQMDDRSTGGIGYGDSTGILENVTVIGLASAMSLGNSMVELRNSTIQYVQRAVDIGRGPDGESDELLLENVHIEDIAPPSGHGAITIDGGFGSARVVMQNTSISHVSGDRLFVRSGQEAVLRNVTFDNRRLDIGSGAAVITEGLVRVVIVYDPGGPPVAGVHVVSEASTDGQHRTATTDPNGQALLWIPAETYDGEAERFIPFDPDGWTLTVTYEGSEFVHTVPWTAQDRQVDLVWDEHRGFRLAGEEDGGNSPLSGAWVMVSGLLAAALLWRTTSRDRE